MYFNVCECLGLAHCSPRPSSLEEPVDWKMESFQMVLLAELLAPFFDSNCLDHHVLTRLSDSFQPGLESFQDGSLQLQGIQEYP